MGEAVLKLISSPALLSAVLSFFGVKAFHDKVSGDIPSFSTGGSDVIPITSSDDVDETKPSNPVFTYDDILSNDSGSNSGDISKLNSSDIDKYVLQKLADIGSSSVDKTLSKFNVSDLSLDFDLSSLENADSEDSSSSSDTLIGLLKANNKSLLKTLDTDTLKVIQVLGALSNAVASVAVSTSVAGAKVVSELVALREAVSVLPLTIMAQSKENTAVLSNVISSGFNQLVSSMSQSAPVVNVTNEVNPASVDINNNIDIQSLVDVLNNHLGVVADAKVLEKENYEYMKTPQSYSLVDDDLPQLAPRDVFALSEAVKAHLNSQEASLTAEDIGVDDYDLDFGDNLLKLFNFVGISSDINKMGGNDNGS